MYVYLEGDPVKGMPASHTLFLNPAAHVGVNKVVADWVEKDKDGKFVGKPMTVVFTNGRADVPDRLGEYLVEHGFGRAVPGVAVGNDPGNRWRE